MRNVIHDEGFNAYLQVPESGSGAGTTCRGSLKGRALRPLSCGRRQFDDVCARTAGDGD